MMLLAILNIQDSNHIPMGMMLLWEWAGYLSPWDYYQNNWGWGGVQNLAQGAHEPLINSDDEITMLILEVPLQNLLAYLIIQSGDANIRRGVLPGFWSPPAARCGALWWQQVHQVWGHTDAETTLFLALCIVFQDKWSTQTLTAPIAFCLFLPPC